MAGYFGKNYAAELDSGYGKNLASPDMLSSVGTGAASGAAAGGPWGALIGAGGGFLSNYLNMRAQEEMEKRRAMAEAAQSEGQGISNAMTNMGNWYSRALLGG